MMDWTQTRNALIAAGISAEQLPKSWGLGANLRGAYLSRADLSRADLRRADLTGADLTGADLTGADLTGADLTGADLTGAYLNEADLNGAYLNEANLRGVNLNEADLTGAYLTGADGAFTIGYFGEHHALAAGGFIAIGCERHTYDEWLERYEEIGRTHDYTPAEINDYGEWIKLAVARQRRIEGIERE